MVRIVNVVKEKDTRSTVHSASGGTGRNFLGRSGPATGIVVIGPVRLLVPALHYVRSSHTIALSRVDEACDRVLRKNDGGGRNFTQTFLRKRLGNCDVDDSFGFKAAY